MKLLAAACTPDELREALRPLESLARKSEKAQGKLVPGTWQHAMLRDHLEALRVASALVRGEAVKTVAADLREALRSIADMIRRTESVQTKGSLGKSQVTLLRNRLKALRVAEAVVEGVLART